MGHPVLRERARRVEPSEIATPEFQKLIDDMLETMDDHEGIGLAAPQVHESVRLVLIGIHESPEEDREADENEEREERREEEEGGGTANGNGLTVLALINPEVRPIGRETSEDWEGCLSLPGLRGRVTRPDEVRVVALDRDGKRVEMELQGYPARVAQHEVDHLDGVLFIDRMKSFETLTFLEEYARYWAE